MNNEKELNNQEAEQQKETDKKEDNTDLKKRFRTVLTVAEVVSVCVVYVLVLYVLIFAERAFAMWDNTTDIIFSSIIRVLGLVFLPIILMSYLRAKTKQSKHRWPIGIIYGIIILVCVWLCRYVGIPDMSYVFEYGKLFQ